MLTLTGYANSEDNSQQFIPAQLSGTDRSLENTVKFPRSVAKGKKDVNLMIRCNALINRKGRFKKNFCLDNVGGRSLYATRVNNAAKSAVINPAYVDGKKTDVWFQYYVVFTKKGSGTLVEVIGNSGLQVDSYGLDYSSPQRIRNARLKMGTGCRTNASAYINAVIDANGVPVDVDVIADKQNKRCAKRLTTQFYKQRFIPAFVNGEAIKAYYSEEIFAEPIVKEAF